MDNGMYCNSEVNLLKEGIDLICKNNKETQNIITLRFEEIITLLDRYIKEIETFNEAYGLVKVKDKKELIIRHILDSIAPIGIINNLLKKQCSLLAANCSLRIADAGSGAGFPGIPLAITFPDCNFTLIERMGRRAGFLYNTTAVLGLSNVTIEEKELEQIASNQFDLITCRAFSHLEPKLLNTLFRVCKETGIVASYKGLRAKIDQEIATVKTHCGKYEIIPYSSPYLNEQRHLVIIPNT